MDPKNTFTAETVRRLQQSLNDVAPYQATELSKQQAIRTLSPQIFALRSKGYSWVAVAAMLSEHGVPMSVAALRTYLRRVREEAANQAPRSAAKRMRDGRAGAHPPEPPPIVSLPPESRQVSPASKPQPSGAAAASGVAVQHANAAAPRREQESRRSTLAVRPDTDDI